MRRVFRWLSVFTLGALGLWGPAGTLGCAGPTLSQEAAAGGALDGSAGRDAAAAQSSSGAPVLDGAVGDAAQAGADAAVEDSQDAGPTDAGTRADAARADAGPLDAGGGADAGFPEDAGVMDASLTVDAGGAGTLEACCAQSGCTTTEATRACLALPSQYGTCAVGGVPGTCTATAFCSGAYQSTPGFCPGPAHIQCCTSEPASGADAGGPPACNNQQMPHPNAGLEAAVHHVRCPPGATLVGSSVCVDVYEAFVRERRSDGGLAEWSPFHNPGARALVAVSAQGAVPQGYINADQAQAACQGAGRRLCTSSEWLQACRGDEGRTYPYGPARMAGTCNDARAQHPAVELFPNDPNPFARIQDACINQLPASLDTTGARAGCTTPEGVMDLMGNLHEWVADADGTFRGGFYVDTYRNGNGCLYVTTAHNRAHWDYSTGFRCCSDALP